MSEAAHPSLRLEVLDGNIALATLDQPGSRANALNQALVGELESFIAELAQRPGLRGLVFRSGKPGMFIAGADLRELGSVPYDADLKRRMVHRGLALMAAIEALPYPTVAAIDGACVGGGLEVALSFDYRLASTNPKTEIGLPEVKVGLIPGWGGTQRLPRIIGPSTAAELICAGETVKADRARSLGIIFDAVPVDKLIPEAVRLIEYAHASGNWREVRQRKQQPVGLSEEQYSFTFAVARAQVEAKSGRQYPAPLAALDAIARGCNQPLAKGLEAETEAFVPLLGSRVSRNLIAVFFMGQRLQKDTGVSDAAIQPLTVSQVGVVGAGIMGSGIAGAHVRRGIRAVMIDTLPGALEKGVAAITKSLQGRVGIGRMTLHEATAALARLSTSGTLQSLADRDVVIEAIIENEEAKTALYSSLDRILRPGALLASNTSTISITRMAKSVAHPELFAGMHFFNPVDRMQLVEVIRGEKTGDVTVATLVALAKRIGKTPIVVRDCPGFLVNRILFPYLNESLLLLQEGASARALDKAATAFGMPMGPVTLNDLVGLDTSLYAGQVINAAFADRAVASPILDQLVAAGRLGQKSGAGFYSYAKGSRGVDDPAFAAILERCRTAQRDISAEEITDRLFLPMLTEASRVLEEEIVREPGDVDMGLILGIGFPSFRGGILRWADDEGLGNILQRLAKYERLGKRFEPTAQMRRLAAEKRGFYSR
jgi:3-hydroxyacyl-CoA dehydrogenase/enoyl-CoA hydratase/3-hydroxybutyryl-CoA epimerase/3-hydroxyacyl-CoA dehydrogenase/enoyl-CoA hydratase/3-hydroxybutyryl-CoA epimerase/enoyl-CoA isomerase